jgi:hypothetical protein
VWHPNWRARIPMNGGVAWIWTFWVLAIQSFLGAFIVIFRGEMQEVAILLFVSFILVDISFVFYPAALRRHHVLKVLRNPTVLSSDDNIGTDSK